MSCCSTKLVVSLFYFWIPCHNSNSYFSIVTDDSEMLAHNTAVMAGVASIESKLDDKALFVDDVDLNDHFTSIEQLVKQEIDDVQQDVNQAKQEAGDAHARIEALIGEPSDIPSITRRKRQGFFDCDVLCAVVSFI
jgi:outer membrane murein-binding lipoprotein Lpp